jgi:hypothetical protein
MIKIESPALRLEMRLKFSGFWTNLSPNFLKYYMHSDHPRELYLYGIAGTIQTKVKLRTILSRRSWQYYLWIDSFIDSFERGVDRETFLQYINWPTVQAYMQTYVGWARRRQRIQREELQEMDATEAKTSKDDTITSLGEQNRRTEETAGEERGPSRPSNLRTAAAPPWRLANEASSPSRELVALAGRPEPGSCSSSPTMPATCP